MQILLHVKWSNFWNTEYIFTKFLKVLGFCWKMIFRKVYENRLIIDENMRNQRKHALLVSCGLRYTLLISVMLGPMGYNFKYSKCRNSQLNLDFSEQHSQLSNKIMLTLFS